jgi:hypothetical protein
VIVRDRSVAVSMARSAMPGWIVGSGVSIATIPCPRSYDARWYPSMKPPPLAIRASARSEQRVKGPLAIRDRRRDKTAGGGLVPKCGPENFVPSGCAVAPKIAWKAWNDYSWRAEGFFSVFCERIALII